MPTRLLLLALVVLLVGSVAHAAAQTAPPTPALSATAGQAPAVSALSLAEAVQLAQAYSASKRAAAARVSAAEARVRQARAENPVLTLAHNFGSIDVATDEGVLLTQTLQVGAKRGAPIRSAQAAQEAAAAEADQAALEVTRAVQEAYYQALQAAAARQLAQEALATAQTFAQAAQVQFEAGDVPQNQVVRSQIDVAKAQQELAAAGKEQDDQEARLRSLVGLPVETPLRLADSLQAAPRAYQLSDLLVRAQRYRPDLRAARLEETARQADVQAARAESHPDMLWELRYGAVHPTDGATGLRVGATFPLLDLGKQRARVQEAEAALAEQRAVREGNERTARLEVETAQHALGLARAQLASFETGRIARAKELLSMALIGYQQGASSYLEVVDAEQAYRTEQLAYVQAQGAYHLAEAALQQAVGGTLP